MAIRRVGDHEFVRRYLVRPGRGPRGWIRYDARRQHRRQRGDIRGGAWFRSRHRRQGSGESDRSVARRSHDAGTLSLASYGRAFAYRHRTNTQCGPEKNGRPRRPKQHGRVHPGTRQTHHRCLKITLPVLEVTMKPVISIQNVVKSYASGLQALQPINLEIDKGEIFALLGPNGAGKTTLINIICGIVTASGGTVLADGHDIVRDFRAARTKIGLVPQELSTDAFETVWATVSFSRGLFGRAPNPAFIEGLLRDLSLLDKRNSRIMTLSGGMKRRVMIAKALSHEPEILFLDEPTAGVDVELRRDMWNLVRGLRDTGVTIILTTHYIEEDEEMADRIGVINKGALVVVEEKTQLMKKLGKKQLTLHLHEPLQRLPPELDSLGLELKADGHDLVYTVDGANSIDISALLKRMSELSIVVKDLQTRQSSLEDIFVELVSEPA